MSTIRLLTTQEVLDRSYGEVTVPATFTPSGRALEGGLHCEAIFGPLQSFKCTCGNLEGASCAGETCDQCHVDCVEAEVRRDRIGHCALILPVMHPLLKSTLAAVLGINQKVLRAIARGDQGYTIQEASQIELSSEEGCHYGLSTLYQALSAQPDLPGLGAAAQEQLNRLEARGLVPADLFLTMLPILPAGLRPVLETSGGTAIVGPINDHYLRILTLQKSYRSICSLVTAVPAQMTAHFGKALQNAVEQLMVGLPKAPPTDGPPILSGLSAKSGRFRQNLIGKRVDFSGRTVLVGSPSVGRDEAGIPRTQLYELFKPHILGYLHRELGLSHRHALSAYKNYEEDALAALEVVIQDQWCFVNRAPSLHSYSVVGLRIKPIGGIRGSHDHY